MATVDIPQSIKDDLRNFRFSKRSMQGNAALVIKINKLKLIMEKVEQFDEITIDELVEGSTACHSTEYQINTDLTELPENAPRYVVLSHELHHSDGRKSYPLVLINWAPTSSETSLLTLHASALFDFQKIVSAV